VHRGCTVRRGAGALGASNIVAVYDVGAIGAQLFIAMELIEGRTVRSWVADEKPDWVAVLAALSFANIRPVDVSAATT
jgi:hypothetical protein